MPDHDLVIRGGTVVDGNGAPPRPADVAVDGDRIAAVGEVAGRGRRELDAGGLLVTPGWVDIHTHYDGQVTWDPLLTPSCWQGVTTVVMGNCGVGFAPVRPDRREWLIALMEGVEDIPGTALHEGIDWAWESFPEYLDALERGPHALDVAAQVPHGAVRGYVMGDRGADHAETPTADEVERMGAIVAEAVDAGALGFTTSRTVNHRSSDGRHTPSLTAGAAELVGIAAAMGRTGRGVLQAVCDFEDLDREFRLLRDMVEASGRPLSVTTLQHDARPDQWRRLLELIASARADGLTMTGQVAARPVGLIISLDGRANPLAASPTYRSIAHLPVPERAARIADPDIRERVLAELPGGAAFESMFPLGDPPDYDPGADASIAAVATRTGTAPAEVLVDTLVAGGGTGLVYVPVMNYAGRSLDAVAEMLSHPYTVPGLGDAGAHSTLICDGSFPTFLASYWARDAGDHRLPVEWVVQRQCRDTARTVGLHDRGVLAPGFKADVNLVDFDRLHVTPPEMRYDLPAGGRRLVQRAEGYRTTVVSGVVTFVEGEPTGELPGRLVRGARR